MIFGESIALQVDYVYTSDDRLLRELNHQRLSQFTANIMKVLSWQFQT